jgi:hypothetical protein
LNIREIIDALEDLAKHAEPTAGGMPGTAGGILKGASQEEAGGAHAELPALSRNGRAPRAGQGQGANHSSVQESIYPGSG